MPCIVMIRSFSFYPKCCLYYTYTFSNLFLEIFFIFDLIQPVDNYLREQLIIKQCVPQESVLNPILFLIYINDTYSDSFKRGYKYHQTQKFWLKLYNLNLNLTIKYIISPLYTVCERIIKFFFIATVSVSKDALA